MKPIAVALALAAVVLWPAVGDAASKKHRPRYERPSAAAAQGRSQTNQFIYRGDANHQSVRSPHPEWDVYRGNGEYAGSDPDPLVRMMLRRDDPNSDP